MVVLFVKCIFRYKFGFASQFSVSSCLLYSPDPPASMKTVALALLVANVSSVSVSSSENSLLQDLSHDATTLGDIAAAFNAACLHGDGKKVCDKSIAELFNPMASKHARFCNSYCRGQSHQSFLQNDLECEFGPNSTVLSCLLYSPNPPV